MNEPKYQYEETKPEDVVDFNNELGELGEKYGFVLCPVPYYTQQGTTDAKITILKKTLIVLKDEGVPSPADYATNDSDTIEKTDETPEAD